MGTPEEMINEWSPDTLPHTLQLTRNPRLKNKAYYIKPAQNPDHRVPDKLGGVHIAWSGDAAKAWTAAISVAGWPAS